jgi:heme-degrading monooxygenase HmoA
MNQLILIDQFTVPLQSREQFLERMRINRNFIRNLPGFIQDMAFEQTEENGQYRCITLATWENKEAFAQAKQAVADMYQKQGFNLPEMLSRLEIQMDRGIYRPLSIPTPDKT